MCKCFNSYIRGLCNRKKKSLKFKVGLKINKSLLYLKEM